VNCFFSPFWFFLNGTIHFLSSLSFDAGRARRSISTISFLSVFCFFSSLFCYPSDVEPIFPDIMNDRCVPSCNQITFPPPQSKKLNPPVIFLYPFFFFQRFSREEIWGFPLQSSQHARDVIFSPHNKLRLVLGPLRPPSHTLREPFLSSSWCATPKVFRFFFVSHFFNNVRLRKSLFAPSSVFLFC